MLRLIKIDEKGSRLAGRITSTSSSRTAPLTKDNTLSSLGRWKIKREKRENKKISKIRKESKENGTTRINEKM